MKQLGATLVGLSKQIFGVDPTQDSRSAECVRCRVAIIVVLHAADWADGRIARVLKLQRASVAHARNDYSRHENSIEFRTMVAAFQQASAQWHARVASGEIITL